MIFDHRTFIAAFAAATVAVIIYLVVGGSVDLGSVIGMLGGMSFNVALFLATVFGLQYFQLGTGRDIALEIFDEHNVAAAIYEGALFLAIAIVIAKGIM